MSVACASCLPAVWTLDFRLVDRLLIDVSLLLSYSMSATLVSVMCDLLPLLCFSATLHAVRVRFDLAGVRYVVCI
jgi:hypothetical protein